MRKLYIILILMVATLMSVTAQATEVTEIRDSLERTIDQTGPAINVTDTVPIHSIDSISEQVVFDPASELELLNAVNKYRKYNGPDFHFLKNTTNHAVKPYTFMQDQTWGGVPVFFAGLIAKSEKEAFRQNYKNENTRIRLIKYNFHTEIDNYTQFAGIGLTVGLKLAGVEGRSSWPRLAASSLASYGVMAAFVNGIKYTASEMRPDGSTRNSWPSGHTATAFVGATILHKEYGLTRSPWYSIAGYTVATATGVMRVLNNRHWVSDVLSGAGIGILSTELAYGICDLLFKEKGLLMNDLSSYPNLSQNPSFFSISMGVGLGNKNLRLPTFNFDIPEELLDDDESSEEDEPLHLKFRTATAVGVEGAWFFCPYVGIGGRLRVKSSPINGWSRFNDSENELLQDFSKDPDFGEAIDSLGVHIESDHITEFAADAGVYFNLPLTSRLALGTKLLVGRSVMDDIDVNGAFLGHQLQVNVFNDNGDVFIPSEQPVKYEWDYIDVHASNSIKFGTGISLTYAHKNSFSWRLFCDYDYSHKTFTASYCPMGFMKELAPDMCTLIELMYDWDMTKTFTSSASKHLHQWVLGGALCVSF